MRTLVLTCSVVFVAACHGITPNPLPTQPAPVALVASSILVTPIPGELPIGGGVATIRLEVRTGDNRIVPNVPVTLTVDGGTLRDTVLVSDSTGHASTEWTGTKSALVRATSDTASGESRIVVNVPIELPPPTPPYFPPQTPTPTPNPTPTPRPPDMAVAISAAPAQVAVGTPTVLTATVSALQAGESVIAYQWDYDANGTTDDTSISPSRSHAYAASGVVTATVTALTSQGRAAAAATKIVVYTPIR